MIAVVNLIGRLGGDPQQKKSQKGADYLTFTLAVDHGYGDNRRTDWYSCIAFDKVCERILKMKVAKGSLIHVIGALELEQYERKDGSKGMGAKVTLYDVEYVSGGGKKDGQPPIRRPTQPRATRPPLHLARMGILRISRWMGMRFPFNAGRRSGNWKEELPDSQGASR